MTCIERYHRGVWKLLVTFAAGCSFQHGSLNGRDGSPGDLADTSNADSSDGRSDASGDCYGTGLVQVCFAQPPSMPKMLSTQTINTDTSPECQAYSSPQAIDACVIAGTIVSISGGNTISAI